MSDIFLSYSSKDRERIRPLEKALEAQGWTVFWDRDIPVGRTWRSFIGQEIRSCLCMVVVWTQDSVESEWVIEEAEEGKSRGILFPVNLDNSKPPFGFGSIQSADLTDWNGDSNHAGYRLLIGELDNHIGRIKEKQRLEGEEEKKKQLEREKKETSRLEKEQQEKEKTERLRQKQIEQEKLKNAQEEIINQQKHLLEQLKKAQQEKIHGIEEEQREKVKNQQTKPTEKQSILGSTNNTAELKDQTKPHNKSTLIIVALSVSVFAVVSFFYSPLNKIISPEQETVPIQPVEQTEVRKLPIPAKLVTPIIKTNIIEPEMEKIPAGSFTMGCKADRDNVEGGCYDDEKPAHQVTIKAFQMSKYEITVEQYLECVKAEVCSKPEWQEKDAPHYYKKMGDALSNRNHPIVGVSWNNATTYAKWLSKATGKDYRLPTEAEWEYAARGGDDKKAFPWGNKASHEFMNYGKDECCDGFKKGNDQWFYTSPVGSFKENAYGLHDMNGNVWEWVQDKWHDNYQQAPADGQAWESGDSAIRVVRGGSWTSDGGNVRSAFRDHDSPDDRDDRVGLRLSLGQ